MQNSCVKNLHVGLGAMKGEIAGEVVVQPQGRLLLANLGPDWSVLERYMATSRRRRSVHIHATLASDRWFCGATQEEVAENRQEMQTERRRLRRRTHTQESTRVLAVFEYYSGSVGRLPNC